jgi:hypothetical protein
MPAHQAEREPARAGRDDEPLLAVPDVRSQRHGAFGGLVHRRERGIDVQVDVVTAAAVGDALHPQVGVPVRRQQRGEFPRRAPERRERAAGHLAPERHPGAERAGREVQEDGQPPDTDRGHGLRAFGSDATTRS